MSALNPRGGVFKEGAGTNKCMKLIMMQTKRDRREKCLRVCQLKTKIFFFVVNWRWGQICTSIKSMGKVSHGVFVRRLHSGISLVFFLHEKMLF